MRVPRLTLTIWLVVFGAAAPLFAEHARTPAAPLAALAQTLPGAIEPVGLHIVSAVAVDLDADGDLDVVATDDALDLIVWMNDGGRFVRQQPSHHFGWQTEAPPPSVDDRPAASDLPNQNDAPTMRGAVRHSLDLPAARTGAARSWTAPYASACQAQVPTRAPPSA